MLSAMIPVQLRFAGRAAGWQCVALLHADLLRCPMHARGQGVSVFILHLALHDVEPRSNLKLKYWAIFGDIIIILRYTRMLRTGRVDVIT